MLVKLWSTGRDTKVQCARSKLSVCQHVHECQTCLQTLSLNQLPESEPFSVCCALKVFHFPSLSRYLLHCQTCLQTLSLNQLPESEPFSVCCALKVFHFPSLSRYLLQVESLQVLTLCSNCHNNIN